MVSVPTFEGRPLFAVRTLKVCKTGDRGRSVAFDCPVCGCMHVHGESGTRLTKPTHRASHCGRFGSPLSQGGSGYYLIDEDPTHPGRVPKKWIEAAGKTELPTTQAELSRLLWPPGMVPYSDIPQAVELLTGYPMASAVSRIRRWATKGVGGVRMEVREIDRRLYAVEASIEVILKAEASSLTN